MSVMKRQQSPSLSRREFFDAASRYTAGGLTILGSTSTAVAAPIATPQTLSPLMPKLSAFVASMRFDAIPAKALDNAKAAITDCLGVAVAGASEESAQILGQFARAENSRTEATLYGQRFRSSVVQ